MNFIKIIIIILLVCCNNIMIITTNQGWWKNTIIYEIYIRSFKDSNGDGVGDLKGITSKLDHFVDLGVDTIWITPFFKSPMIDLGYDISDYFNIDPIFGTMQDFDELIREMKKRGMKLIMDLVINHTSEKHPWFEKSIQKIEPYTDYYVWKNPKDFRKDGTPIPPNNWVSLFGGSAWRWNQERKQFYYHKFESQQPDLNLRNEAVKFEVKEIIKFWYDKGISGFRLDAASDFMEDILLRDEPLKNSCEKKSEITYWDLNHTYTTNQLDTVKFMHDLRELSDSCYNSKDDEKILIPEVLGDLTKIMMYYGNETCKMAHMPLNFGLMQILFRTFAGPVSINRAITDWLNAMPPNAAVNWLVESHDNYRLGNRLNNEFMDVYLIIIMLLPGVACIYYGQEIGMTNTKIKPDPIFFTSFREWEMPARHPMQWDDSANAGFTTKKIPWLPVNTDYWQVNVETQKTDPNSRYNLFKTLSKLRRRNLLKHGKFKSYLLSSRSYAFTRYTNVKNGKRILVVMNLSFNRDVINLGKHIPNLPSFGKILASSLNIRKEAPLSSYHLLKFTLKPVSIIVFEV